MTKPIHAVTIGAITYAAQELDRDSIVHAGDKVYHGKVGDMLLSDNAHNFLLSPLAFDLLAVATPDADSGVQAYISTVRALPTPGTSEGPSGFTETNDGTTTTFTWEATHHADHYLLTNASNAVIATVPAAGKSVLTATAAYVSGNYHVRAVTYAGQSSAPATLHVL